MRKNENEHKLEASGRVLLKTAKAVADDKRTDGGASCNLKIQAVDNPFEVGDRIYVCDAGTNGTNGLNGATGATGTPGTNGTIVNN